MTIAVQKANRYIEPKYGRVYCGKCRTFLNMSAFSPKKCYVLTHAMGWRLIPEHYDEQTGLGEIPEHWICPRCFETKKVAVGYA